MIKAIFFDMTDVIFTNGLKHAIAEYGKQKDVNPEKIYRIAHDFDGWKDFTLGNISEREFCQMCDKRGAGVQFDGQYFLKLFIKNTVVDSGIASLIKKLSKVYIIGVISNSPKELAEQMLKSSGLENFIKVKALSSLYHVRKPDKKIFIMALDEAGVNADEAIYIDDRNDRVDGAIEAGMHIIVFKNNVNELMNDLEKFNLIY